MFRFICVSLIKLFKHFLDVYELFMMYGFLF